MHTFCISVLKINLPVFSILITNPSAVTFQMDFVCCGTDELLNYLNHWNLIHNSASNFQILWVTFL